MSALSVIVNVPQTGDFLLKNMKLEAFNHKERSESLIPNCNNMIYCAEIVK